MIAVSLALEMVVNKIKKLFLIVFGLIKRSLCCFKRRRRLSCDDSIPLTNVQVGLANFSSNQPNEEGVENWSWEEPPSVVSDANSVQHHIERYRQQSSQPHPDRDEEPDPDFFEDMAPKITKQTKILIRPQGYEQEKAASRLNFVPEPLIPVGPELGSWEENENTGGSWEESEAWDMNRLVREKRKADREMQAALKKDHNRIKLGSKESFSQN